MITYVNPLATLETEGTTSEAKMKGTFSWESIHRRTSAAFPVHEFYSSEVSWV